MRERRSGEKKQMMIIMVMTSEPCFVTPASTTEYYFEWVNKKLTLFAYFLRKIRYIVCKSECQSICKIVNTLVSSFASVLFDFDLRERLVKENERGLAFHGFFLEPFDLNHEKHLLVYFYDFILVLLSWSENMKYQVQYFAI